MTLRERVARVTAWWEGTRLARALARFSRAAGGVLTGGIAYAFLFSLAAALTLGFTGFVRLLGGNPDLRADLVTTIDGALPGLLETGDGTGLLDPEDLVLSGTGWWGLVAAGVLLWSATVAMAALRTAVRAVAGETEAMGAVGGKARELAGFLALGVAVLLAAALGLALTTLTGTVADALGWPDAGAVVGRVVAVVVTLVLDAGVFVLVVKILAGLDVPGRALWSAAALAAVAFGAVRLLGAAVVAGSATTNPLFASVAVLATLLVWLNLLSRIVLTAVAWMVEGAPQEPAEPVEPSGD